VDDDVGLEAALELFDVGLGPPSGPLCQRE
jgi:hypothetical protein